VAFLRLIWEREMDDELNYPDNNKKKKFILEETPK